MEATCSQQVQCSKSGMKKRKSRQRKNRINRKNLSTFLQSSAAKIVNEKVIELENNCKSAKQVANGYFYKWKKKQKRKIVDCFILLAVILRKKIFLKHDNLERFA